jgi:signal transduction histidine kinase
MKVAVARGKKITQEIVHFTRQPDPVIGRIEVLPYLRTISQELMPAVGRSIDIAIEVSDEALSVNADAAQLREVFTQLAINARDAMSGGGLLTLAASRASGAAVVQFRVIDTGTGMTTDVQQRAFEPLFTTKTAASGLGLPLVDRIIKAHGGELFLESETGRGTSVYFSLPAADPGHGPDSHGARAPRPLHRET